MVLAINVGGEDIFLYGIRSRGIDLRRQIPSKDALPQIDLIIDLAHVLALIFDCPGAPDDLSARIRGLRKLNSEYRVGGRMRYPFPLSIGESKAVFLRGVGGDAATEP